jgi:cyclopropane-fatty-acyl-phospholipid synthase
MFWDRSVEHALTNLKKRVNAPVRVVLWDGREFALSGGAACHGAPEGRPRRLRPRQPDLRSLAEAYIEGHADFEGDLREAIRGAEALSRSFAEGPPRGGAAALRAIASATTSRRSSTTTTSPTTSTRSGSIRAWCIPAPISATRATRWRRRSCRSSTTSAASCAWPRERNSSTSAAAGARSSCARRRVRVDATGITLSENQYRLASERIRGGRPAGPLPRAACSIIATRPAKGRYDKIASVGMFEHVGLRNLPEYFGTVTAPAARAGALPQPRHHRVQHRQPCGGARRRRVHRPLCLSARRAAAPASRGARHERADLEVHDVECLRPHYAKTLGLLERQLRAAIRRRRWRPRASAPRASGASTSRAARTPSSRAGSRSTRSWPRARSKPGERRCRSPGTGCTAGLVQSDAPARPRSSYDGRQHAVGAVVQHALVGERTRLRCGCAPSLRPLMRSRFAAHAVTRAGIPW